MYSTMMHGTVVNQEDSACELLRLKPESRSTGRGTMKQPMEQPTTTRERSMEPEKSKSLSQWEVLAAACRGQTTNTAMDVDWLDSLRRVRCPTHPSPWPLP